MHERLAYVAAGAEAPADHAYYLEMRDRSGFDLDGQGQIDRDPIGVRRRALPRLHRRGARLRQRRGTDDPPAQSPLDSTPEPGNDTPDLNDAAFTAAAARSTFSDAGEGHTDNYNDPANSEVDQRYADVPNPWRFRYDCLGFEVTSMTGTADGPATSDGDLTGDVSFDMGDGCGEFDYGYAPTAPAANTAPTAAAAATPTTAETGEEIELRRGGSDDAETPDDLDYSWDFGDGGRTKDATGRGRHDAYDAARHLRPRRSP